MANQTAAVRAWATAKAWAKSGLHHFLAAHLFLLKLIGRARSEKEPDDFDRALLELADKGEQVITAVAESLARGLLSDCRIMFSKIWTTGFSQGTRIITVGQQTMLVEDQAFADAISARFSRLNAGQEMTARIKRESNWRNSQTDRTDDSVWTEWLEQEGGECSPPRFIDDLLLLLFVKKFRLEETGAEEIRSEEVRHEGRRSTVAYLTHGVVANILLPIRTGQTLFDGSNLFLRQSGKVIGVMEEIGEISAAKGLTADVVRRGLDAFHTVLGHRILQSVVRRVGENKRAKSSDPRIVSYVGGIQGLLNELGIRAKNEYKQVREILHAGQQIHFKNGRYEIGRLWEWGLRRGSRRGPGELRITAGDMLMPCFVYSIPKTGESNRIDRRLIPELRHNPPTQGVRRNDYGKVQTLAQLVMVEMVDNAAQLIGQGGLEITPERWEKLAGLAGLSIKTLTRTLSAWEEGEGEKAPPLLIQEGGRWRLAIACRQEVDFIVNRIWKGRRRRKKIKR